MKIVNKVIAVVLPIVAIAMAVYQMMYTQMLIQDPDGHVITHLGLALVVVFLSLMLSADTKSRWYIGLGLFLLSVAVTGYLMIELDEILEYRTSIPAPSDLVAGTLIIIILIVGNWVIFGRSFPIVCMIAIVYLIFGRYLPPPFTVPDISYWRLLMWMSVELGTGKGVYGDILELSANYLFLFIFFGGILDAFGGTRFIIGLGRWVGSKMRAGPAMVALIGSSLLGTVTGSTVANITITGSFTIPMMKKSGYTPEQAGAIETVSSNGGQIIPPIMGATAFLMASYTNIPYIEIVKAAIIPALLYVGCVFLYITLTAYKMEIRPIVEKISGRQVLLDSPIFFFPLGVLVYLLAEGYTLPFVGFWSIITTIVVGTLTGILRKDARLSLRHILRDVVKSTNSACSVAMICGLLGVVVSAIVSSGLGIKLPLAIEDLSGGILAVALFITMVSSIILGIGVPTPAAYMLVAVGAVPSLLNMGVPLLAAHLYCFYFAICSHITPPVAVGALVAAQIAGADYWKTAWEAVKAAFAKYLLPIFFIYAPVTILMPEAGFWFSALQLITILVVIATLQIGISNYCFNYLERLERFGFILASILGLFAILTKAAVFFYAGFGLFVVCMGWQVILIKKTGRLKPASE
ncbi:MAG: TRAP transporter fused permease subunit [Desulfobacterales bacterium]|nr:TRAP transporter fused permease subunit [Desulfobacterales bacterium]